jgi:hypothetical protein
MGPETPGQPAKQAVQGQAPGIETDPGQVGEDRPAQQADVGAQGLSVAASPLLRVAPDFQRAQHFRSSCLRPAREEPLRLLWIVRRM